MPNVSLSKISIRSLCQIISSTNTELIISLPSIHKEIADSIIGLKQSQKGSGIPIHIVVDFQELVLRSGYGTFQALETLKNSGLHISTLTNNRVSFIISDDQGYLIFIESRFFNSSETPIINGVKIDSTLINDLKETFVRTKLIEIREIHNREEENISNESPLEQVNEIEPVQWEKVSSAIKLNPPINPDFQRVVNYYSTILQYVTVSFEGANISKSKLKIPSDILPINDSELNKKLETKLGLFDGTISNDLFKPVDIIKNKIEKLREKYLLKVKFRPESIIKKTDKQNFNTAISQIQTEIDKLSAALINSFQKSIDDTFNSLTKVIEDYFIANPKALFTNSKEEHQPEYIKQVAAREAERLAYRINWPYAHDLTSNFKLVVRYSDITFEDLNNNEFMATIADSSKFSSDEKKQLIDLAKGLEEKK